MKLSEIVQYLNHLDTLSVQAAASTSIAEVAKITHIVHESKVQIGDLAQDMVSIQEDLKVTLQKYEQTLTQLRENVQALIEQHELEYFAESTTRYQEGMRFNTPDIILNRTLPLGPISEKLLRTRLAVHASWQYPGMVIRPAHGTGLENLVALDPVYLVDTHNDLFSPVRSLFTPEYQRRLRYYVIEEYTDKNIFWDLPQKQFGLIYAFRYFEFKPWEILQQYLTEVFDLLRPGGTFLFSFNDCDQWTAVGSVEHVFCCYTPGRLIRAHAQEQGYEIVSTYSDNANTSWMELRRPGVLDSIRGGQALASIQRKVNLMPEVVDKTAQELYNELNLDQLIKLARILNVDISEDVTKYNLDFEKVRRTISAHLQSANHSEKHLRRLFKLKENP